MARVTSKLQVTIPKAVADSVGIAAGDELTFVAAGESIRVLPEAVPTSGVTRDRRLELFDAATERQRARETPGRRAAHGGDRGWRRDDLYERGRAR